MWLCMKWHDVVQGCILYIECAETAAVSGSTSHVTTKQYSNCTLVDILRGLWKASHLFRVTCDKKHLNHSESAWEQTVVLNNRMYIIWWCAFMRSRLCCQSTQPLSVYNEAFCWTNSWSTDSDTSLSGEKDPTQVVNYFDTVDRIMDSYIW